MGDPRKNRRKYQNPKKPWDKARLDAEKVLVKDYGTKSKHEIYKMRSLLRKFSLQAKKLMSATTSQSEQEKKALLSKLNSLAIVGANSQLDDVLALQLNNIMERRLQTLLLRKGLANTVNQARQFIVHRHIKVGNKIITSPSYLVSKEEENMLGFTEGSTLANPEHPERPEQIFKLKNSLKKHKATTTEAGKQEVPVQEKQSEVVSK